jgi:hypothetical protein
MNIMNAENTITAEQFFSNVTPLLDARHIGVDALVRFDIEGKGSWCVDFATHQVTQASDRAPAVIVRAFERDFVALVQGHISPADGLLSERLHVAGDAAVIGAVMSVLERMHVH